MEQENDNFAITQDEFEVLMRLLISAVTLLNHVPDEALERASAEADAAGERIGIDPTDHAKLIALFERARTPAPSVLLN